MPNAIRAALRFKTEPHNSWVQFYGAYVSPEIEKAILAAGWEREKTFAPPHRWTEGQLRESPYFETDTFYQKMKDPFWGNARPVGNTNIRKLRRALARFGVTLGRPIRMRLEEML
jgi:hypothetical protein